MRDLLAERLLATVLQWKPEDVADERPVLQAFARLKYDEYQQFAPGMRFIESLAVWLAQFRDPEERRQAYQFVRNNLHFISWAEMAHLVAIAYRDFIRVGLLAGLPGKDMKERANSREFRLRRRKTLFLGLSDGAHLDVFRRSNPELSNEQIYQTYLVAEEKAEDLKKELDRDLRRLTEAASSESGAQFETVVLLDDFTASGLSYVRKKDSGEFGGKISRVLRHASGETGLGSVVANTADVEVLLYVATEGALERIRDEVRGLVEDVGWGGSIGIRAIQVLPNRLSADEWATPEILDLLREYMDDSIVDRHFRVGRHDRPYLGFDECGLPLVLYHNTPNNSLPILWFERHRAVKGLFPRVSRHGG